MCSDPAVTSIVDALKADPRLIGKAKVTAFDYPAGHTQGEPHPETHDVFLFPAGVHLTNVPTAALPSAVADILTHDGDLDPLLSTIPGGPHQILKGPSLIICCHTARDARCGSLGPPLASKLLTLGAQVIISSHVGGHQYAGNVIVYGRDHPASCDWFGGVCEPTAAEFWGALCALDTGEKAVENKVLRKFWRGRTGLTKDQQKELYEACTGVKDIEDMKA